MIIKKIKYEFVIYGSITIQTKKNFFTSCPSYCDSQVKYLLELKKIMLQVTLGKLVFQYVVWITYQQMNISCTKNYISLKFLIILLVT